jgi:hypothetical protein
VSGDFRVSAGDVVSSGPHPRDVDERLLRGATTATQAGGAVRSARSSSRSLADAAFWKTWIPIPLIILLLDCTFNLYFWHIPKLSVDADWGYQFVLDVHELHRPKKENARRVLAFGSSVAGSLDPVQLQSLLDASGTAGETEVHRLLKPGIKPSDYRLFFAAERERMTPDVVILLFNPLDFLNPTFERGVRPSIREALPPWTLLRERGAYLSGTGEGAEVAFAGVSRLYRYRRAVRSAVRSHVLEAGRWWRSPRVDGAYGWYADGYTRRRFGVVVGGQGAVELEYEIDPEWIRQRGQVQLTFSMHGEVLARRTEKQPGWHFLSLAVPSGGDRVLHVSADSAWTPLARRNRGDTRLLGVRMKRVPAGARTDDLAPYRYPPFDRGEIVPFLRMGRRTGEAFVDKWYETLHADTPFAERFRAYQEAKLEATQQPFEPTAEYAEFKAMVEEFVADGIGVVLVNTPESPWLLQDYEDTPYYRDYLRFFGDLAGDPSVLFFDLRDYLPPVDFNDWHHTNYIGTIKLGPIYAHIARTALAGLTPR